MSLDSWHVVATTSSHYHKVALAYGRSPSWSSGRYFAVWQEQDEIISSLGHIYTAHTNPDFNSPFTTPINLDSLNPVNINKCKNPTIACQYNNVDNDSSNLTEVVLFDKYNQSNQKYDLTGYYNLQATNHSKFKKLIISDSLHNNIQPDINFNPYDSTFMVTYFDSTTQKLPFLINNYNLINPNQWEVLSTGYNDSSNLSAPYPKVVLNMGQQQGADVWAAEGTGGHGIAMFDAQYSTYTGIAGNNKTDDSQSFRVFPNPCNSNITIYFDLQKPENVTISLYNLMGQREGIITDQYYQPGKHQLNCNITNLSPGSYLSIYKAGDVFKTGKLTVIR